MICVLCRGVDEPVCIVIDTSCVFACMCIRLLGERGRKCVRENSLGRCVNPKSESKVDGVSFQSCVLLCFIS